MTLHHGDSLAYLKTLPDNSVDAVVTDPPYGLGNPPDPNEVLRSWLDTGHHDVKGGGFMGKEWDAFVPQPAFWKEVYRVLKPGGHVAAFFGTRTYDWGTMAIRLAGFEVRCQLTWVFGSGFPKGNDISKAIDELAGAEREVVGTYDTRGLHDASKRGGPTVSTGEWRESSFATGCHAVPFTAPATVEAREWQGWNTQLKPAHEPICLARKPCSEPTVAANVLKWRTGALNIGACRVGTAGGVTRHTRKSDGSGVGWHPESTGEITDNGGRYPATLLHDGSDTVSAEFPVTGAGAFPLNGKTDERFFKGHKPRPVEQRIELDSGSAARYFNALPYEPGELDSLVPFLYCAKASPSERNAGVLPLETRAFLYMVQFWLSQDERQTKAANHPAVKPIRLMEWLCNLLTPPGGTILDPFMGSGTTGIAAGRNGFDFIGCELQSDYHALATERIAHWTNYRPELPKVSNPKPLEPSVPQKAPSESTLFS